ncbi:hypothetical protein CVT26_008647 [Gymnopilus dilepis]|uniref:Uncharacterized protein n=1 Tax=Gymnopilus dilepis TaxID=231916 RepID=A0A409XY27_9AGAR|nr:hypothetical protein CVT26_008647 [Gymnopilus dilepis]
MHPFLPSLETFQWEGRGYYPWDTIPGLLRPVIPMEGARHRPLKSVKINCVVDKEAPILYIPNDVFQHLLGYSDVKFEFTLNASAYGSIGVDLWKASLEKYSEL